MGPINSFATSGAVLAGLVLVIASLLMLKQWHDRRGRGAGLSAADARHFARQDLRRVLGAVIMVVLAAGIAVGSQLPHRVAGRPNRWFIAIWTVLPVLILVLVGLALFDLIATRAYARRHRRALIEAHRALIARSLRGHPNGPSRPPQPNGPPG
jgi:cytochrome bd-type quinol oxidase subunit 2